MFFLPQVEQLGDIAHIEQLCVLLVRDLIDPVPALADHHFPAVCVEQLGDAADPGRQLLPHQVDAALFQQLAHPGCTVLLIIGDDAHAAEDQSVLGVTAQRPGDVQVRILLFLLHPVHDPELDHDIDEHDAGHGERDLLQIEHEQQDDSQDLRGDHDDQLHLKVFQTFHFSHLASFARAAETAGLLHPAAREKG